MDKTELLKRFCDLPTGNIADAAAKLKINYKTIPGLFPLSFQQKRTAGFAVTVKQMERNLSAEDSTLTRHASVIDTMLHEGDMLVIDVGGKNTVCTGGALLALRAQLLGASGFIVNGCLRDLKEIAALEFPVYLKGGSPVKSSPSLETVGINVPIEIDGTQIVPGDLIIMDETGIVVVPIKHAETVCKEAEKICALEELAEAFIRQGHSVSESLKLAAEQL